MQELIQEQEDEIIVGLPSVHNESWCMSSIGHYVAPPTGRHSYEENHTLRIGLRNLIINAPIV